MNCIILSFFVFRAVFVGFSIVLSLLRRLREREGSLRGVEQTSRAASGQNFCAAAKKAAKEAYIAADLPGFAPKLPILPVFQRRNAVAATTKRLMVFSLLCRFTAFFHCSIFSFHKKSPAVAGFLIVYSVSVCRRGRNGRVARRPAGQKSLAVALGRRRSGLNVTAARAKALRGRAVLTRQSVSRSAG